MTCENAGHARLRAMNVAFRKPRMTREQFFEWAQAQDEPYEFDGFQPVAMTGGTAKHNVIALNIHRSLYDRLKGNRCRPLGMDAGLATVGNTVRYPDALVTCSPVPDDSHLIPGVVVVFEVLSPTSGRMDRIVKVREYRAVPSIRRYVMVEYAFAGLTVLERADGDSNWTATTLTDGDTLQLPEIGITMPVAEIYAGTGLANTEHKGDTAGDASPPA